MIAITGGLGFVGLHTAAKLIQENHGVVLIDNQYNSRLFMLERLENLVGGVVTYVNQDFRNTPALQRIFQQYKVSAVVHMGGVSACNKPCALEAYNSNVSGILSVLKAMSRSGINTLVYGSCAHVLAAGTEALSELDELDPSGAYSRSFDMCEQILSDMDTQEGWRIAVLRYFEVGGAHPSHIIGEYPKSITGRVMPAIAQAASQHIPLDAQSFARDDQPLVEAIDLLHIDDVVEANLQALAYLHSVEGVFEVFNVGSAEAVSWQQITDCMSAISGAPMKLKLPEELSDRIRIADITHVSERLKWAPKQDLEAICQDALAFYQAVSGSGPK